MTEMTLHVESMTCAHCASRVEAALLRVAGVSRVRVDLASGRAVVQYDDSRTGPPALLEAVRKVGYEAGVESAPATAPGRE